LILHKCGSNTARQWQYFLYKTKTEISI